MGTVQLWNGAVLLVDGKVAIHGDCCCLCDRIDTETQPDAVVSVGNGGCDPDCYKSGVYSFVESGVGDTTLWWTWHLVVGEDEWNFHIYCCTRDEGGPALCINTGGPYAFFGDDLGDCPCSGIARPPFVDVTDYLSVVGGVLTGEINLIGDVGTACAGCVATITLG